ncbi:protein POLYCHOME-like [Corylus avellana]|uniref:protein POLYCHOME-like n=1 Tax=Corylus avellana TaxID=13451 RepID=UPI00286CA9FC|nr:protein POLYCHOME-like [Corylus avellana]
MPESRDRRSRPVDYAAVFVRRRAAGAGFILEDQETGPNLFDTPVRRVTTATTPSTRGQRALGTTRGGGFRRGGFGTPRSVSRRVLSGSPATGRENTPSTSWGSVRNRPRSSVLPSWYPRVPLQEITWVMRAIERRRARLGDVEGLEIESPVPEGQRILDPSALVSGAQLEHDLSLISPRSAVKPRTPAVGKVPKILLEVANQNAGGTEFLTPQKKLLNSIDMVEKEVMKELQKLKRTPSAKKVEREKRVRTLMSIR